MRGGPGTALTLVAALTVAACSSGGGSTDRSTSTATLAVTKVKPHNETNARPSTRDDGTITLAFAGDVHFEEELEPYLDHPEGLAPVSTMFGRADLTMVNLETAITARGTPEPKKYHFRTPPAALTALMQAGVDAVSMANNHAVDYGMEGLTDTLAAQAESPIPVIGIGRDADAAFAPYSTTIDDEKITILAATQVPDHTAAVWAAGPDKAGVASARDPQRLLDGVRAAGQSSDLVVVFLHWGTERVGCPTAEQRMLARALAEAGADIVVGTHAHVPLGAGWLGDTFVDYGLGNFMWYGTNSLAEATTGVLTLTVKDGKIGKPHWRPARIQTGGGLPIAVVDEAAKDAIASWRSLRMCTGLAAGPAA